MLVLVVARARGALDRLWLASPWHAADVAAGIAHLPREGGTLTTCEGVHITAAPMPDGRIDLVMSRRERPLRPRAIAALAAQLGKPWRRYEVLGGRTPGVIHLLLEREP